MGASRSSSEHTGSMESSHSHKNSLQTKADPNVALYEAQPMDNQPGSQTFSLRSIQHKDLNGNIISDPDLCNPTRSRLERPLDTIRSFEAAIDAHHKRNHM
ncbi:hypothetical protein N7540_000028 [Penicillium herquei]|nr:hypothetical protein N7540_000028 [Penicillium herquei]